MAAMIPLRNSGISCGTGRRTTESVAYPVVQAVERQSVAYPVVQAVERQSVAYPVVQAVERQSP
jgi:hypothetical protein